MAFGGPQWAAALYLAVVCGAGIYYLWSFALGTVSPTRCLRQRRRALPRDGKSSCRRARPRCRVKTAERAPTQRDRHLQHIADHGRMAWQQASGYTKRARAEAAIGRWKQVIGDRLRAHTDERRATEVDVAVYVLNRMLELGRPNYVRTA